MQAMSNHPHSTCKLLPTFSSSASSTCSDHHKLSRGSCTGLLFQLFDWNSRLQKRQLFRLKSLPAERPAGLIPKDLFCGNEKLSSAKMLNTSDEAGVPCHQEGQSEDAFQKDQTPEKKRKKRSPNVVAKLMGLETMPSPDLRREKWPIHYQRSMPIQSSEEKYFVSNPRIPSSRRSLMETEKGAMGNCSSRRGFSAEPLSQDSSHVRHDESILHDEARCQAKIHKDQAHKVSTMVASQSPTADAKNGAFGCIFASSNTHNKIILPVKSASASKTTVLEVANKVLEQNRQPRNALIRLVESSAGNNENEKENDKKVTQRRSSTSKEQCVSSRLYPDNFVPHCASKPDRKITDVANLPAASRLHAANNRQSFSSSSATNVNIKEDAVVRQLKQGQGVNENKDSAKWHSSQQGAESSMEKKGKPRIKRQKNTRTQLNEANGTELQSTKPAIVKLERDLSSSKTIIHHHESHETSSTSSTLSTITQNNSVSSSNDLSKHRRLSSSGKSQVYTESKIKSDEGKTAIKSLYTRGAGTVGSERPISRGRIRTSKCKSMGNKVSVESIQEDASSKSCISKESIKESGSIDQDISRCNDVFRADPLNEAFCCTVQNFDDALDEIDFSESVHEGDETKIKEIRENLAFSNSAEITSTNFDTENISSDISIAQNTCRSSCVSSIDEMRDTASSCDIDSTHRKKQTVSYSGKSTATILQELLSALNSSKKIPILENEQIPQESEVSGVTSTTIKTTENPLNASSSCTGEDDSNSLALSTSSSNVCLQNSAGGSEWLSSRDYLMLRGCKNKCWQSSPTASPFYSEPEEHDFWQKGSKCRCNSTNENYDEFICSRQISNVSQGREKIIQSEEGYVDIVVKAAKLCPDDIFSAKLQATDCILDPAIFNKLEAMHIYSWKWRSSKSEAEVHDLYTTNTELVYHDEDVARDYRKLMFDCIQESLCLDLGISEHSIQIDYVPPLHLPREARCRKVLKHIHDWKDVRCGMNVDDMVENAMNTGNGKWVDFSNECVKVAGEVADSVYGDLVDELVLDLISCFGTTIPDARSAKTARLGRIERKKVIWVGL